MNFLRRLFGLDRSKRCPHVVVDFSLIDERFYLSIANCSDQPVYDVCISFDRPLKGHNGTRNIAELPIVKQLPVLAPFKKVSIFIDPVDIFFHYLEEDEISIDVQYKDRDQVEMREMVLHNLRAYHQLPANSRIDFI